MSVKPRPARERVAKAHPAQPRESHAVQVVVHLDLQQVRHVRLVRLEYPVHDPPTQHRRRRALHGARVVHPQLDEQTLAAVVPVEGLGSNQSGVVDEPSLPPRSVTPFTRHPRGVPPTGGVDPRPRVGTSPGPSPRPRVAARQRHLHGALERLTQIPKERAALDGVSR